jgi:pyruvate-ferredoxin/flavodoxin oxidoreductase
MIEGFIQGLKTRRPALFNIYSSCQPEHGIGDDMSARQAKLAVESRAYPLFRYNPDKGETPEECFELEGNPAIEDDWPTYTLRYKQGGRDKEMDVPMTFVDFAITEARFRKHFRTAPQDAWNDDMLPLAEFLDLAVGEREGKFPYVWSLDRNSRLTRLLVDKSMVESCEERRGFWRMLRAIAGVGRRQEETASEELEQRVRQELIGRIAAGLLQIAGGGDGAVDLSSSVPVASAPTPGESAAAGADAYMAPWIDTEECTSCDECTNLNPKIFAYNDKKKAFIQDPNGGPYSDLVKAAEKCTARVIHPGLPRDRSAKDIEKWIQRAERYN